MMRRTRSLLVAILLLSPLSLLSVLPAISQVAPDVAEGITPGMVHYVEDIDSVDMVTDLLNIHIPLLVDHSQRGKLNFTYVVSGGGSGSWYVNCTNPSTYTGCAWYQSYSAGAGLAFAANGALFPVSDTYRDCCYGSGGYNTFRVQEAEDRSGALHQLGTVTKTPYVAESVDGSGIREVMDSNGMYALTNSDGVQFHSTLSGSTLGSFVEDANGNTITTSVSPPNNYSAYFGSFSMSSIMGYGGENSTTTDTLGRIWTWTETTDFSSCPIAAVDAFIWSTPGYSGGTRNFKFCRSNIPLATNFQVPHVPEDNGTAYGMMTGVVLPDGTAWRFDYINYGDVAKIYLPTGGTISYGWTTVSDQWGGIWQFWR